MQLLTSKNDQRLIKVLRAGGVAVVRTDTLYGIVAKADNEEAVQRVYDIRGRDSRKPCIVLISDLSQLYDSLQLDVTGKWPGSRSIILPSPSAPEWLRRGGNSLAYRLPADSELRTLLEQTGPLIAPSANPAGQSPARSIAEAQDYFGDEVDCYVDEGEVPIGQPPSELWGMHDDQWERLR